MASNKEKSFNQEKGLKVLIAVLAVALIIGGGYFAYQEWIVKPKSEKAASAMVDVERFFENQQYEEAINGDGQNRGALAIISDYGNTKSGNLARYYAGMSFLHLGEYEEAIKHLDAYKKMSGTVLQALAEGGKGDAHLELGHNDKAEAAYRKVINYKDELVSPIYLFRLAMLLDQKDQKDEAVKLLKEIKSDYPLSVQAQDVDKYLGYLGGLD